MNKEQTIDWIRSLPLQTLTDELKETIINKIDDIEYTSSEAKDILRSAGYIVDTLWSWNDAVLLAQDRNLDIPYLEEPEFRKLAMRRIGEFDAELGINYDHIEMRLLETVKLYEKMTKPCEF